MKISLNNGDEVTMQINGREVTVKKLSITPEMANEIISYSDSIFSNRKSNAAHYKLYSNDMKRGEWKTNGETLKFSAEGALIDGRNRLNAVMLSGKPVDFLCVGNLDQTVADTIDIGMKRTLEHALKMQGYAYENSAAAIVKQKLQLDRKSMSIEASEYAVGISRLDEVHEYEKNQEQYIEAAKFASEVNKDSHKALNKPEVGAIYLYLIETLKWDKNIVLEFFDKLATPTSGTFFWTTYETLKNKKVCRGKERFYQYIMCWNAYIKGNRTKRVSLKEIDWFISPND